MKLLKIIIGLLGVILLGLPMLSAFEYYEDFENYSINDKAEKWVDIIGGVYVNVFSVQTDSIQNYYQNNNTGLIFSEYNDSDARYWSNYTILTQFRRKVNDSRVGVHFYSNMTDTTIKNGEGYWIITNPSYGYFLTAGGSTDFYPQPTDCWRSDIFFDVDRWVYLFVNVTTLHNSTWIRAKMWYINESEPVGYGIDCYDIPSNRYVRGTFGFYSRETESDFNFISINGANETSCTPDWVCTGYGACNISDLAPCNNVTDNNACGFAYSGDYSEFAGQACDYCQRDIVLLNTTACINGTLTACYEDLHFATCCDVTGLASDCYNDEVQVQAIVCVSENCTIAGFYDEDDLNSAIIDTIVRGILSVKALIVILIIAMFIIYIKLLRFYDQ